MAAINMFNKTLQAKARPDIRNRVFRIMIYIIKNLEIDWDEGVMRHRTTHEHVYSAGCRLFLCFLSCLDES